ncbi:MAG TPA: hypothetical protein VFZ61_27305, partial [Polyangiales bacterium]
MYADRGFLDRTIATFLVAPALLVIDIQLCGLTGHFRPWPLALVGLALFGATAALALRHAGVATVHAALRSDLRAPLRLATDTWRARELAVLTVPVLLAALFVLVRMVWYFKSWTWDPVWYHVPITGYAIQEA